MTTSSPYDTIPNAAPRSGDDHPDPLHCMVIVDLASSHVCHEGGGRCVGSTGAVGAELKLFDPPATVVVAVAVMGRHTNPSMTAQMTAAEGGDMVR